MARRAVSGGRIGGFPESFVEFTLLTIASAHSVVAAAASTEYALHLLLHKAAVSASYNDDTSHAASAVSTTSKPKLVWSPLILKADRPEAEQHITNLESSIGRSQGNGLDLNSAKIVRCWALYHVGAVKDCLQALADVDKSGLRPDQGEGYDQVLRVIANAVEGQSSILLIRGRNSTSRL